jgi:hypothetical protein
MAEEEHGLHEEPRPSEHRTLSPVEREREWLAKQYSKEREATGRRTPGSLMEPEREARPDRLRLQVLYDAMRPTRRSSTSRASIRTSASSALAA